jgi:quercetin dioxygenase-like cupin family protein
MPPRLRQDPQRCIARCLLPWLAALGLLGSNMVLAQQAPADRKGISGKVLTSIELGGEMDHLDGLVLRMRTTTIEPGGSTGMHDHKGHPSVIYILQGPITEIRGDTVRELRPGDVVAQGKQTQHALENRGTTGVVFLQVEVIKAPRKE